MRKLCLAALLVLISGCDSYDNFSLNLSAMEYRNQCFGSLTNDCVNMRVDYNIQAAEYMISIMEKMEDDFIEKYGQRAYDEIVAYFEHLISVNEEDRPNFFLRLFAGEGEVWSPRKFPYMITEHDFTQTVETFTVKYPKHVAHADQSEFMTGIPVSEESDTDQEANSLLMSTIDAFISDEESYETGAEYRDARSFMRGDLNGDGEDDMAVLYTLEGAYGGNSSYWRLAVFLAHNGAYSTGKAVTVGGASAGFASIDRNDIALNVMTHGPDDARCCPSISSVQHYLLQNGSLRRL